MKCGNCGREIGEINNFCKYCGSKILSSNTSDSDTYIQNNYSLQQTDSNRYSQYRSDGYQVETFLHRDYREDTTRIDKENQHKKRSYSLFEKGKKPLILGLSSVLLIAIIGIILFVVYKNNTTDINNINSVLSKYGITRVFLFEDVDGYDFLNLIGQELTEFDNCTKDECSFGYNTIYGYYETPVCYTFHGDKKKERQVLNILSKLYSKSKNYERKRELKSAICWIKNDISDEKIKSIKDEYSTIEFEYDSKGRIISCELHKPYISGDELKYDVSYKYDETGNIVNVLFNQDLISYVWNREYQLKYKSGVITKIVFTEEYIENGYLKEKVEKTYNYGEKGQIISEERSNEKGSKYFFYDNEGHIEEIREIVEAGKVALYKCKTDKNGNILSLIDIRDETCTEYYEYDDNSNLTKCTYVGDEKEIWTFKYDEKGNIFNADIFSDGVSRHHSWEYNDEDFVAHQTEKAEYEDGEDGEGEYKEFSYDTRWDYEFDKDGKLVTIKTITNNGSEEKTIEYIYI